MNSPRCCSSQTRPCRARRFSTSGNEWSRSPGPTAGWTTEHPRTMNGQSDDWPFIVLGRPAPKADDVVLRIPTSSRRQVGEIQQDEPGRRVATLQERVESIATVRAESLRIPIGGHHVLVTRQCPES